MSFDVQVRWKKHNIVPFTEVDVQKRLGYYIFPINKDDKNEYLWSTKRYLKSDSDIRSDYFLMLTKAYLKVSL